MQNKLRVLLLVAEPWRTDDGGGNTINNFFKGMDAEFAQIYCSAKLPQNDVCDRYYQITDEMVVKAFLKRKAVEGNLINGTENCVQEIQSKKKVNRIINILKKIRWNCFITAKNFMWRYSKWENKKLDKFILDFNPDVIYAPCYASPFQLALTRYVKKLTNKKILTWSADDNYSLKQFSLSPFFWVNRIWNRKCLRKTYSYYDSFYSISEDEVDEMESVVGQKIKILRKGIEPERYNNLKNEIHTPIKMIYAGGIYIQRWKTLGKIGEVLKKINRNGTKIRLDIYTQNEPTKCQIRTLHDAKNIFLHPAVGEEELKELYGASDIAIHCESFSLKNRLLTRLSFSTKIMDCLASGCAVMAVAWKEQTGLKYLKKQDAAICVTSLKDLEKTINEIVENPQLIIEYSEKARNCGIANHNIQINQRELFEELLLLSKKGKGR